MNSWNNWQMHGNGNSAAFVVPPWESHFSGRPFETMPYDWLSLQMAGVYCMILDACGHIHNLPTAPNTWESCVSTFPTPRSPTPPRRNASCAWARVKLWIHELLLTINNQLLTMLIDKTMFGYGSLWQYQTCWDVLQPEDLRSLRLPGADNGYHQREPAMGSPSNGQSIINKWNQNGQ